MQPSGPPPTACDHRNNLISSKAGKGNFSIKNWENHGTLCMTSNKQSGRPTEARQKTAGKQLGIALKILGKTWRKDTESRSHVHNWKKWNNLNLPRSATTIDKDINDGIPDSRVSAYAHCLGIAPTTLLTPQTDLYRILFPEEPELESSTADILDYQSRIPEHYFKHNNDSYIKDLFELIEGVYRMNYVLQGIETLHRCTIWIKKAENNQIYAKARFIMFGIENEADANIFRWHNNLHYHYLCENKLELGYLMTVDPLRHNLVRQRNPFWLKGQGLTDRGSSQNPPITLSFLKEKLQNPYHLPLEELWEEETENMRFCPHLRPIEPGYEALRRKILAPDQLDFG